MKLLTNKGFTKKLIIVCIILLLFNFIFPMPKANAARTVGGILIDPIIELLLALPAALYNFAQYFTLGEFAGIAGPDKDLNMKLSPALIFSNNVPLLDVNFINPKTNYTMKKADGTTIEIIKQENVEKTSIAQKAKEVISGWYTTLRYIAIVGLLIVLVYIGIKMLLTSVSSKKAHYKQMLTDWLVALVLVVCMHYFMAGVMTVTEEVTKGLGNSTVTFYKSEGGEGLSDADILQTYLVAKEGYDAQDNDGIEINFADGGADSHDDHEVILKFAYLFLFIVFFIYTMVFLFQYLRRVLYMAFLTIISPMVCLTYPIDKIKDGSAQAFNMWFKEYVFNALIQPFHLLIYVVFMGVAKDMKNFLVTIIILGFLVPAEKFLRNMFGFNKATTNGAFLGAAAGSALMNGIRGLTGRGSSSGSKSGLGTDDGKGRVRVPRSNSGYMSAFKDGEGDNTSAISGNEEANMQLEAGAQNNNSNNNNQVNRDGNNVPAMDENQRNQLMYAAGTGYNTGDNYQGINTSNTNEDENAIQLQRGQTQGQSVADANGRVNRQLASYAEANNGQLGTRIAEQNGKKNNIRRNIKGIAKRGARKFVRKGIPSIAKIAAKTTMAAGVGAVGLAAGVVTGEPSKAFAFAAAGAGVGAKLGDVSVNKVTSAASSTANLARGAVDLGREALYGERYSRNKRAESNLDKAKRDYMRNENVLQRARNFQDTSFEGMNISEEEIANKMFTLEREGITEDEDMKQAFLLEDNLGFNTEQAATIVKQGKNMSYEQLTDPTYRKNTRAKYLSAGLSEAQTQHVMEGLDFNKGVDTVEADRNMNARINQPRPAQSIPEEQLESTITENNNNIINNGGNSRRVGNIARPNRTNTNATNTINRPSASSVEQPRISTNSVGATRQAESSANASSVSSAEQPRISTSSAGTTRQARTSANASSASSVEQPRISTSSAGTTRQARTSTSSAGTTRQTRTSASSAGTTRQTRTSASSAGTTRQVGSSTSSAGTTRQARSSTNRRNTSNESNRRNLNNNNQ